MTGFTQDIFISYAHIDNQPLTPGESGWITNFHATLEALLNMRLGHPAQIWRDEKLQGNDVFSDEIVEQFGQTAVLLSVLTPRYLTSEWCTKEVNEFCVSAEQSGGVVLDNKARVFKVMKTPVDTQEALPSVVKDVLGYEFFTYENETPLELDAAYGEEYGQAYKRKVAQLASDLSQLLKKLESENPADAAGAGEKTNAAKPTVYLAECSFDQKETRGIIEGELIHHGYHVLPDRELPRSEENYIPAVESLLLKSDLSIHLIGDLYGAVPEGPTQKSVPELQNEIASAVCKRPDASLQRVIWLPLGTKPDQPQHQTFINSLHRSADAQFGADLITGDLETLKTAVHNALVKIETPEPELKPDPEPITGQPPAEISADSKLLYLYCTASDRKSKVTVPLRKYLRAQGFDVKLPSFEGDAATVRENHQQLMSNCDAIILFYGAGDEAWKHTFDIELKKMPGYRNGKSLLASYIYLAEPATADKEDLVEMEEPCLINGFNEFSETSMSGFLQDANNATDSV